MPRKENTLTACQRLFVISFCPVTRMMVGFGIFITLMCVLGFSLTIPSYAMSSLSR